MSRCLLRLSLPSAPLYVSVAAGPSSVVSVRFKTKASLTAASRQRKQAFELSPTNPSPSSGSTHRVHPLRQKKKDAAYGLEPDSLSFSPPSSSPSSSSSTPLLFGHDTPPPPPDPSTLSPRQIRMKANQLEWFDGLDSLPVEEQEAWKRQARIRRKAASLPSDEARAEYYESIQRAQYMNDLSPLERKRVRVEEKLASMETGEERQWFLWDLESKALWERMGNGEERRKLERELNGLWDKRQERKEERQRELEGMEEGEEKEARRRELKQEMVVSKREISRVKFRGLGMDLGEAGKEKGQDATDGP
ncbi:hypothetical protein BDY24DRAFT_371425 [Mrakia frigida]|uniref:uncharacterized protein n=1 Tax=Mrakia frigida TaxID=29902 RepID=UPI003FCC0A4F